MANINSPGWMLRQTAQLCGLQPVKSETTIDKGTLEIPQAEPLPGDNHDIPYFLITDDTFMLRTWMMKPFSAHNNPIEERIFNE